MNANRMLLGKGYDNLVTIIVALKELSENSITEGIESISDRK